MKSITEDMIVGAQVVAVHAQELSEDGRDSTIAYFTVDHGFTFQVPSAGYPWMTCSVPDDADALQDEVIDYSYKVKKTWFGREKFIKEASTSDDRVKQIKMRKIKGVYCAPYDEQLGFHYPLEASIVFEDGSQAHNTLSALLGASLIFDAIPDQDVLDFKVSYFSIPLRDQREP